MSSKQQTLSVAEIEQRRAEMVKRLAGVQEGRRGLALALVEGDGAAKAKDASLAEKQAQYETAIQQFDDALVAAKARDAQAQREKDAVAAREKAADIRARPSFYSCSLQL